MPQFDNVTFFNQIFWFLVIFLSFYFIVLKKLLPVLATTLKTRKKLIHFIFSVSHSSLDNLFKKSLQNKFHEDFKSCKQLFFGIDKNKLASFDLKKNCKKKSSFSFSY